MSKSQKVLWMPFFRVPWMICWPQLPMCRFLAKLSTFNLSSNVPNASQLTLGPSIATCNNLSVSKWLMESVRQLSLHLDASEMESSNKLFQLDPNCYSKIKCLHPSGKFEVLGSCFRQSNRVERRWIYVKNKFLYKFGCNPVQHCVSAFGFTQSKCLCVITV